MWRVPQRGGGRRATSLRWLLAAASLRNAELLIAPIDRGRRNAPMRNGVWAGPAPISWRVGLIVPMTAQTTISAGDCGHHERISPLIRRSGMRVVNAFPLLKRRITESI